MESKDADWDCVAEDAVEIDAFHRTSVPGVFAAAVAMGSLSAAAVVQSLLADDVGLPVPPSPNQKENDFAHV